MKFLITGGAGFLGINLVRYLLKRNHTVVSYDIAPFDYEDCMNQVEIITGDIRNKELLIKSCAGIDIVVHSAAALPLYSKEDIYTTDIDGTHNVLEAAKINSVKRVIQISSTAVYGIPDHHPLFETDKLQGVGPYGEAKILAEEECLKFRKDGMIIPIIRPKSFIGPERLGVFHLLYDWAKDGHGFPIIGKGNNRYQFLDVEDLCQAIYLTSTLDENIVNDTFNIGAKEFTTMKEDYQTVLDDAGFGKKISSTPEMLVINILRLLEALKLSPLYKWVYETASKDSFVSIEKAEKILGYKPQYSNKDALLRNFRWYKENLHKFEHSSGVSHRVPWKQGILSLFKLAF